MRRQHPAGEALKWALLGVLLGLAGLYFVDDTPKSCRDLAAAQRRCQFDGCDVRLIERLRKQCDLGRSGAPEPPAATAAPI